MFLHRANSESLRELFVHCGGPGTPWAGATALGTLTARLVEWVQHLGPIAAGALGWWIAEVDIRADMCGNQVIVFPTLACLPVILQLLFLPGARHVVSFHPGVQLVLSGALLLVIVCVIAVVERVVGRG